MQAVVAQEVVRVAEVRPVVEPRQEASTVAEVARFAEDSLPGVATMKLVAGPAHSRAAAGQADSPAAELANTRVARPVVGRELEVSSRRTDIQSSKAEHLSRSAGKPN